MTITYHNNYLIIKDLVTSKKLSHLLSEEMQFELLSALEGYIIPKAALRLYEQQREAVDRYEAALMGLFDDFEGSTLEALEGEADPDERKRRARERAEALAYWMVMASWDWIHYGYAFGKLSVWFSQTDELICYWEWQRNRLFVYRELFPDLIRAIEAGIEQGKDIEEIVDGFRWRVKMYGGHMWMAMQKGTIYRPVPEERRKAERRWEPSSAWWVFPLVLPLVIPLRWEPPAEWGVPEEYAPEIPRAVAERKEMYWHGLKDERTCVGERGCWDKIGRVWPVTRLEMYGWWPGEMDCLTNCRCTIFPVAEGRIRSEEEWYELPWGVVLGKVVLIGDECPTCKASNHTGIWDGRRFIVCPTCNDTGVLDEKAMTILGVLPEEE